MAASERWWFWALMCAVGIFSLGYAAATGGDLLVVTLPFVAFLEISSGMELVRTLHAERDQAIRDACRFAEKARRLDRIS